jgi:hypothetical protein
MSFLHHRRGGKVQLIEAAVNERALRVQHGAHGAIGDDRALEELPAKLLLLRLSHGG